MRVDPGSIETTNGGLVPMMNASEIKPARPNEPHYIECVKCSESLEIDIDRLLACRRGTTLVFPCPRCATMKVISMQCRLMIGDGFTP